MARKASIDSTVAAEVRMTMAFTPSVPRPRQRCPRAHIAAVQAEALQVRHHRVLFGLAGEFLGGVGDLFIRVWHAQPLQRGASGPGYRQSKARPSRATDATASPIRAPHRADCEGGCAASHPNTGRQHGRGRDRYAKNPTGTDGHAHDSPAVEKWPWRSVSACSVRTCANGSRHSPRGYRYRGPSGAAASTARCRIGLGHGVLEEQRHDLHQTRNAHHDDRGDD